MNKSQRIKSLTWKYFWEQKKEEINNNKGDLIGTTIALAVGLLMIGLSVTSEEIKYGILLIYIGAGILIFWILVGIIVLLKNFIKWIKSNWIQAKQRAIKEVKNGTE